MVTCSGVFRILKIWDQEAGDKSLPKAEAF